MAPSEGSASIGSATVAPLAALPGDPDARYSDVSFSFFCFTMAHQHHQTRPTIITAMMAIPNHGPSHIVGLQS